MIHAFLYESGLEEESWASNEEMVDWFAIQFPKIAKAFIEAGCSGLENNIVDAGEVIVPTDMMRKAMKELEGAKITAPTVVELSKELYETLKK